MKKEIKLIQENKSYTIGKYILESKSSYNNMIDYTYLKTNITIDQVKEQCELAEENKFHSIVVYPDYISTAKAFINTKIKITSVLSFPKGKEKTIEKVKNCNKMITDGVDEIDMCIDIEKLKKLSTCDPTSSEYKKIYDDIFDDIRQITSLCHRDGIILKVIIESGDLNFHEIKTICDICTDADVDFIQTSTGFAKSGNGAELEKVKYMRKITPDYIKIKVTGGIRTIEHIKSYLPYVDRIGTSVVPIDENDETPQTAN